LGDLHAVCQIAARGVLLECVSTQNNISRRPAASMNLISAQVAANLGGTIDCSSRETTLPVKTARGSEKLRLGLRKNPRFLAPSGLAKKCGSIMQKIAVKNAFKRLFPHQYHIIIVIYSMHTSDILSRYEKDIKSNPGIADILGAKRIVCFEIYLCGLRLFLHMVS